MDFTAVFISARRAWKYRYFLSKMGEKHNVWKEKLCGHLQYILLYIDLDYNVDSSDIFVSATCAITPQHILHSF